MMKSKTFVDKAIDIAKNYKTLYVMGAFGAPLNSKNKARYTTNNNYNKKSARKKMINAASSDTFGFDCVCLIKGILWNWNGDKNKTYGGAKYASNGVPDIGADTIIKSSYCNDVSKDFKNIQVGEIVWMSGHVGIYIGNGLAVECSPKWGNDVQITAVANIGKKSGYNARKWTKHGKLKYIDYSDQVTKTTYQGTFPKLPIGGSLKRGSKGTQVKYLQKFLNWANGCNLEIDGSCGALTEAQIKVFQKANGLKVDGKFGPASLKKAKTIVR